MHITTDQLTALIADSGYAISEPVIAGVEGKGHPPVFASQGETTTGKSVYADTITFAASLSKQITAGCAALLVRAGALDMDDFLARWVPGLPEWAETVRLRHLLHHTAALPDPQAGAGMGDLTSAGVLSALAQLPALARSPGAVHEYSSAGYVCLAAAVERAAGQSLPEFAAQRIFAPLGMNNTCFWAGPASSPHDAAPLTPAHPAPLALGSGGVWSTARDLLRWSQALNADELGISGLMQTPGSLDDGAPIDYAWGMGVRSHTGYRVYWHGGGWPGLRVMLVRIPDLKQSLVIIALADDSERREDLAASMLNLLTAQSSTETVELQVLLVYPSGDPCMALPQLI